MAKCSFRNVQSGKTPIRASGTPLLPVMSMPESRYEEAARRELREEIGIECAIDKIGKLPCSRETGWEFIEVFRGLHEGPFRLAAPEIETAAFFPLPQIQSWLERNREDFSPVFVMCLRLVSEAG